MRAHEIVPVTMAQTSETADNIKIIRHDDGVITVSVSDKTTNSDYEYVYKETENGLQKVFEQKITHIPDLLCTTLVMLWLIFMVGLRYLSAIMI